MRITDMKLDTFGIYHQASWTPPVNGLIIMYGRNESGKTTLMKYVRSMMFGYERGAWQGYFGNMEVERDGRRYRIYRNEKQSYIVADEETIHEEPADLWWHGLERETYEKIFALGLEDLQGFKILSNDAVRSRFFSIEGGERLGMARRELSQAMSDLLVASPAGKKKINVLLAEQKEWNRRVRDMSRMELEFADLQEQEARTHEEEETLRSALIDVRQRKEKSELSVSAWDVYKRGRDALEKMNDLSDAAQFPVDGKSRWHELDGKLVRLEAEIAELEAQKGSLTGEAAGEAQAWAEEGETFDRLYSKVQQWRQWEARLEKDKSEQPLWEQKEAELIDTFDAWGNQRPVSQEVDWETAFSLAVQVREAKEKTVEWESQKPRPTDKNGNELMAEPAISTQKDWDAFEQRFKEVRQILSERRQIKEQIRWFKETPAAVSKSPLWLSLCALAIAAGLGAGAAFLYLPFMAGMAGAGAAAVLALVFYMQYRSRSNRVPNRLAELDRQDAALAARLKECETQLNLGIPADQEHAEEMEKAVEALRRDLIRWQEQEHQRQWQKEQKELYEAACEAWRAEGKTYQNRLEEQLARWNGWQKENQTQSVRWDAVSAARQQWELWRQWQEAAQRRKDMREQDWAQVKECREQTEFLFSRLRIQAEAIPDEVERQYEVLRQMREKVQAHLRRVETETAIDAKLAGIKAELETRRTQRDDLFKEAGVQTTGEFRRKILRYEQYKQYQEIYKQSADHLCLLAKGERQADELRKQLEATDIAEWKRKLAACEKELDDGEKKLAVIAEKRGALVERLRQLAGNEDYTKLLQEQQNRETLLQEAIDDWLVKAFAQRMMAEAQGYYERERQPEVIRKAGEYVQYMTQGRYTLQSSADGKTLYAVDQNQRRVPEGHWSSGLGDQIYLAVRISLAAAFAEQIEQMPLILDDILVRFDKDRQKEALQFLGHLGQQEQVFLFTCQEQTKEIAEGIKKETGLPIYIYDINQGVIMGTKDSAETEPTAN